jgi:uncharacterized protein YkwD
MLRRWVIAVAIMAGVCGVADVASAAARARAAAGGCPASDAVVRSEAARLKATSAVLCLVNRVRAGHGARALRASAPLASAATSHSAEMIAADLFSHVGPDGSDIRTRIVRAGYRPSLVDETIAWGSGTFATPAQFVDSFMRSPLHRHALLERRYRDVGVGLLLGAPAPGVSGPAATLTLNFGRR